MGRAALDCSRLVDYLNLKVDLLNDAWDLYQATVLEDPECEGDPSLRHVVDVLDATLRLMEAALPPGVVPDAVRGVGTYHHSYRSVDLQ